MFLLRAAIQRIFSPAHTGIGSTLGTSLNTTQVRTKVRYHLPYPTEVKRVRKQGFKARLKSPGHRKIMMERILRGDKVIAH